VAALGRDETAFLSVSDAVTADHLVQGVLRCRSLLLLRDLVSHASSTKNPVRRLTNGKGRLDSPADWPVPGLLVHIAGQGANGWRVVDVWESEEAFRRFGEKLGPVLKAVGVEATPEVYPAHTFVSA
jgi:hypothetical protein